MASTPMPEATRIYTVEDMYHVPRDGRKFELIQGELIVSPAGMQHENIAAKLIFELGFYLRSNRIGELFTSIVGFNLPSGDVLSPDVSYVRLEQLPGGESPVGFGQFAPDLAVEIVSPSDSLTLVEEKVDLYLSNGSQLVWIINPKLRRATVYRADGSASVIRGDGALEGEAVLPGFRCALADVLPGK